MYTGNRNFDPDALRLTKIKPNQIFNHLAISREPIDEINSNFFYLKGVDSKITPNPIGLDRTNIAEVGADLKYLSPDFGVHIFYIFFCFKNVIKKSKL